MCNKRNIIEKNCEIPVLITDIRMYMNIIIDIVGIFYLGFHVILYLQFFTVIFRIKVNYLNTYYGKMFCLSNYDLQKHINVSKERSKMVYNCWRDYCRVDNVNYFTLLSTLFVIKHDQFYRFHFYLQYQYILEFIF